MPESDAPLGVAEAAAILHKDRRQITRMIRRGELAATKMPGHTGAYLIERGDVEALRSEIGGRAVAS